MSGPTIPIPSRTSSDRLQVVAEDETRVVADPDTPLARLDPLGDLELLPRLHRLLASELHDLTAKVYGEIMPTLKRIEERQQETDLYLVQQFRALHLRLDEVLLKLSVAK